MSGQLEETWGAFSEDVARRYLKTFGNPSQESKLLVHEILEGLGSKPLSLLDLGCGNANLAEYLSEKGLSFQYTGVDFSEVLLQAAKNAFPKGVFICDDVNRLCLVSGQFDVGIYSHVVEMLPSPESSLLAARKLCKKIIVRFFEPPSQCADWVDLSEMDVGSGKKMPYLRRKMSQSYYEMILEKMGCTQVDVYRTSYKDQVHVLHY
jgi:2-polyprenyl-3-methyl-5-hydroxy-6-metoxy-1,4-benzoquinol methylase